jgi:cysteine-rich secretory family protein
VVVLALGCALLAAPLAHADGYSAPDEARMHQLVNAARAAKGLPALARVDALVQLSRRHSSEMAKKDALFHNTHIAADLQALGVHASWTGENAMIAINVDEAMEAFMDSPHHRDNILRSNYTALGVGVLRVGDVLWITQTFAQIGGVAPRAPAPTRAPVAVAAVVATRPPAPPPPTPKPTPVPTPKPTPTPRPVTPNAIERGIVTATTTVPAKAEKSDWPYYLLVAGLIPMALAVMLARRRPTASR